MSRARASRDTLEKRRADRSARFFLTGGTGFLGSHIAVELLKKGFRVTLPQMTKHFHSTRSLICYPSPGEIMLTSATSPMAIPDHKVQQVHKDHKETLDRRVRLA